jgi:glycosyltransferase involved in cell wall biosynthesis
MCLSCQLYEGVPVTVMEALSCGVQVWLTGGGNAELVDSLVGGLLQPDLLRHFCRCIVRFLEPGFITSLLSGMRL